MKAWMLKEKAATCANCGDWSDWEDWTEETATVVSPNASSYSVYDSSYEYYVDDTIYSEDLAQCPSCDCWFKEWPEIDNLWQCTECKSKYSYQDGAEECCQ